MANANPVLAAIIGAVYSLKNPIGAMGNSSDVLLMQQNPIALNVWKFKEFGTYKYSARSASEFEGFTVVAQDGSKELQLSFRDVAMNPEIFGKFIELTVEDGQIKGAKVLAESCKFGVSVERRPYTETERQIELSRAETIKPTNPTRAASIVNSLAYDKKTVKLMAA